MPWPRVITDVLHTASGTTQRIDPVVEKSGGPAGNARLTAWTGLVLLALIGIEMVTALDVHGMLSWHIVVGTLLLPVALLKTATTGWRIGRYYTGHRPYVAAGPPPMLLRVLGPLVVLTTLGLLGSGLGLISLGTSSGRSSKIWLLGLDMLTLHQALFIGFTVVTGLHILARLVPAVQLVTGRLQHSATTRPAVPGGQRRFIALLVVLAVAVITAAVVLPASTSWQHERGHQLDRSSRTKNQPIPSQGSDRNAEPTRS